MFSFYLSTTFISPFCALLYFSFFWPCVFSNVCASVHISICLKTLKKNEKCNYISFLLSFFLLFLPFFLSLGPPFFPLVFKFSLSLLVCPFKNVHLLFRCLVSYSLTHLTFCPLSYSLFLSSYLLSSLFPCHVHFHSVSSLDR